MDHSIPRSFLCGSYLGNFSMDHFPPRYRYPENACFCQPGSHSTDTGQLQGSPACGISGGLVHSISSSGALSEYTAVARLGTVASPLHRPDCAHPPGRLALPTAISVPRAESQSKRHREGFQGATGYHRRAEYQQGKDSKGHERAKRPTFTGYQIFILEKMFEQSKYLPSTEKARLAHYLSMTESQVKVWFQNRRTKWRKRRDPETVCGPPASETDKDYDKPLNPDFDDEKVQRFLHQHCQTFPRQQS